MSKEIAELKKKLRIIENDWILAQSLLEAIDIALDGGDPGDFMMSFAIVRRVWDLVQMEKKQ